MAKIDFVDAYGGKVELICRPFESGTGVFLRLAAEHSTMTTAVAITPAQAQVVVTVIQQGIRETREKEQQNE